MKNEKHRSIRLKFVFMTACLLCLLITQKQLLAQTSKGSIEGMVQNERSIGLDGINLTLQKTNIGTVSDSLGYFILKDLAPGKYTLIASALTIEPITQTLWVKAGEITRVAMVATEQVRQLKELAILANRSSGQLTHLPALQNNALYAGKKTEVIHPNKLMVNLAINPARLIYAKTPGISVWENEGSGIQTGIASRGLSPNRSWEFNVRQNGYDVSPDVFGYPEAYYSPPSEAVEEIQIVRGASVLQYGPQFGGLLNYQLKKGDATRPISFEAINTIGSNRLFNSFIGVGGTKNKWNYLGWFHHRNAKGWRQNSRYQTNTAHFNVHYALNTKVKIGAEYTQMDYESQQAGGLTDATFAQNAQQSFRGRNWFGTPWHLANLYADITYGKLRNKFNISLFGLIAERNSIGFVAPITTLDTISTLSGNYAPRQIDRDAYKSGGIELRTITHYPLWGQNHTLAAGARFSMSNTNRKQQGQGSTGTDFDLQLQQKDFNRNLLYGTQNLAFFAENLFALSAKLSLTPGIRVEHILSDASGRLKFNDDASENRIAAIQQTRNLILFGLGTEYKPSEKWTVYGNISQNYRPVLYSDLTPPANTDVIDPDLKDASGFTTDLGVRGKVGSLLNFDISTFYIHYKNRIGTLTQLKPDSSRYQFRTNIGTSVSKGIEAYVEFSPLAALHKQTKIGNLNVFASLAFIDAEYTNLPTSVYANGVLTAGNLKNKRVENAPKYIHRFGANYAFSGFSVNWQMCFYAKTFSDANNTETPTANAQNGVIPAYKVMDISAEYRFTKGYTLSAGINNLANARYFTRRTGGYPGPGLLPADGRTYYVSFAVKL